MRHTIGLLALANLWLLYTTPFARSAEPCPPAQAAKSQKAPAAQAPVVQVSREGRAVTFHFSRGRSDSASPAPSELLETWICKGSPRTGREAALEDALHVADEKLAEYLRSIRPESDWPQSLLRAYVLRLYDDSKADTLALEEGAREQLKARFDYDLPDSKDLSDLGDKKLYISKVGLNLTREFRDELVYKLRLDEAKQRQWWLAKALLAALALCATVGLYYRFDERTKGYYTNWLRVGALALLAIAGYGIVHLP
jgi:hypothetical protein